MSPRNYNVTITQSQHHVIDTANLSCALDDCVEDRLHVRGRAADDAEHLGRRRLALQSLSQFRVALLNFLEQPDVLYGNYGLIGEGFDQLDLPLGKQLNKVTPNYDYSDGQSLSQQWYRQQRPRSPPRGETVRATLCC